MSIENLNLHLILIYKDREVCLTQTLWKQTEKVMVLWCFTTSYKVKREGDWNDIREFHF